MAQPSIHQLERHIRASATNSAYVAITRHAELRMRQRKVTRTMLFDALRQGRIHLAAEPSAKGTGLVCRMERHVAGTDVGAVVYVEWPTPDLVVVTVIDL